ADLLRAVRCRISAAAECSWRRRAARCLAGECRRHCEDDRARANGGAGDSGKSEAEQLRNGIEGYLPRDGGSGVGVAPPRPRAPPMPEPKGFAVGWPGPPRCPPRPGPGIVPGVPAPGACVCGVLMNAHSL